MFRTSTPSIWVLFSFQRTLYLRNDCRLAPWYSNANCDACLMWNPALGMSRPDEQRKVCDQMLVLLFLVVSLTGIFRHLICNIVCIYLYIYVCRRTNKMRTHTQHTRGLHTVSVSQSERGNLVFSFRECLLFAQMRVIYCTSCTSVVRDCWPCTIVAVYQKAVAHGWAAAPWCRPLTILLAADGQILSWTAFMKFRHGFVLLWSAREWDIVQR